MDKEREKPHSMKRTRGWRLKKKTDRKIRNASRKRNRR